MCARSVSASLVARLASSALCSASCSRRCSTLSSAWCASRLPWSACSRRHATAVRCVSRVRRQPACSAGKCSWPCCCDSFWKMHQLDEVRGGWWHKPACTACPACSLHGPQDLQTIGQMQSTRELQRTVSLRRLYSLGTVRQACSTPEPGGQRAGLPGGLAPCAEQLLHQPGSAPAAAAAAPAQLPLSFRLLLLAPCPLLQPCNPDSRKDVTLGLVTRIRIADSMEQQVEGAQLPAMNVLKGRSMLHIEAVCIESARPACCHFAQLRTQREWQ